MTAIGIDMGKSAVKFASEAGVGEIPSYVARGTISRVLPVQGTTSRTASLRVDGIDWILGDDAVMGTNFVWQTDENKSGERNQLFILAVLGMVGIQEANIVVGLPVSIAENEKSCEEAKQAFSGERRATINGREMTYRINARVVAEPLGTYFSLVMDEQARPLTASPFYRDQMAVVDIGFRTVDIVTLRSGGLAAQKDSTLSGTVTLFEKAWKMLEQSHGMLKANERVKVYEAATRNFGTTSLRINGEHVSPGFWREVTKLKRQLALDIVDEVRGVLGNIRPDHIVMTGGGSLFLRDDLIAAEKSLIIHQNPRYANAIGFYRAAIAESRI
jgi:plasmid segregation protein ParM